MYRPSVVQPPVNMEHVAGGSILNALYMEASTRRHTKEDMQADVLAAESARRDASKLSASSALMTSLRLRREIERVFEQRSLADTGLLTRSQLQAALHSLGLLASKPPAFSSSVHRTAAAPLSTASARHLREEGNFVNSLWQLLAGTQSQCNSATHRTKVSPSPSSNKAAGLKCLQPDAAAANQAESCDTLLCESIDLWRQLIGEEPLSIEAAHAVNSQTPANHSAISAAKPDPDFPLPVHTADSMCSTSDQPASQKLPLQLKEGIKSTMHGVSLQQLLAFVQHVQQHSGGGQAVQTAAFLQAALTDRQNAQLDRIARICSQNKLANMAYVGIGNRKFQSQSILQLKAADGRTLGRSAGHAEAHSQHPDTTKKWQPRGGHSAQGKATVLASQAVRFSRRNFRQQQQQLQLQQSAKQQLLTHSLQVAAAQSPRYKPFGSELGRLQPFARSKSTAADMVKQRKALAELEMLPCTFHPALDPHSLALVAAKASACRPPQKAALPHRQPAYMPDLRAHICSVSSSGIESGQEADTTADSARASAVAGLDGSAYSPVRQAVTSRDIQEKRALKECTFAPRLNTNKAAKSVVAQIWKDLPIAHRQHDQHCAARFHRSDASQAQYLISAGAKDESPAAASAKVVPASGDESPDAASAAVMCAGGDKGSVLSDTHKGAQSAAHQPASTVSTTSSLSNAQNGRQLGNSYAACARRSMSRSAAGCSAVPAGPLQQQQHATTYDALASIDYCAEIEARLQAEVAGCDKLLEQCMAARQQGSVVQKAVSDSPSDVTGAGHQVGSLSHHASAAQWQQSALKVAIEAEMADGSASRFEVQQADQLRHLTRYFAKMMELQGALLAGQSQITAVT